MTDPLRARNRLGVVFFPAFDWAISATHPEREERLLYTRDQLAEEGLFDIPGITEYRPELATDAQVERVHFCLPSTGAVVTDSHRASAGGAITAARLVMEKKEDKAFALVRPPGHHAMRVTHGNRGFCNINNEAVMVEYIRDHYPHPTGRPLRIAIVDTDVHHGDGSQDIFWNDPHTLFISLHQDGRTLYPGTGFPQECGGPGALGRTINIPLPPETSDEGYLYAIEHAVLPMLADFKPDLVINSAGQDNHFTDPLANMKLSAQGYAALNRALDPDIAVLEGGYAIRGALPYVNLGICLALAGLDAGRYDIMVNGVDITPERAEKYDFSTPYAFNRTAVITKADDDSINTLEDLKGKKTANTISSTYAELAEQYGATVTGVDDLNQTFELLLSGRIDATLNAEMTFYDYTKEHPDANVKIAVLTDDANQIAIPMRKGDETATLRTAIDAAIDELRADGTLKALSEKYFGRDISTEE